MYNIITLIMICYFTLVRFFEERVIGRHKSILNFSAVNLSVIN